MTEAPQANPNAAAINPSDRKVSSAYWLWFFFGALGGHQFYMGNKGRAISYIFTVGWLTVGVWIDLFTMRKQVERANARRVAGY